MQGQLSCLSYLIRHHGLQSLWRGTLLTYCREIPSFATYFTTYEILRTKLMPNPEERLHRQTFGGRDAAAALLSGGLAGVAAWAVVIPADAAKTLHQASLEGGVTPAAVVRALLRSEGPAGFYKAAGPVLLRAFPANAATFLGYELAVHFVSKTLVV